jgi:hypothetical protein
MQVTEKLGGRGTLARAGPEPRRQHPGEEFQLHTVQFCREPNHPIWGNREHSSGIFYQNSDSRTNTHDEMGLIYPCGARLLHQNEALSWDPGILKTWEKKIGNI